MKRIIIAFIIVLSMAGVSCDDYLDDLAFQSGLNEGLVAYWPVTESYNSSSSFGKTIKDYSGYGYDLISYQNGGGPTALAFIPGVFSTAMSFDGSNDYALLSRSNLNLLKGRNEFTLTFWYYPKSNVMGTHVFNCNAFYVDIDGTYLGIYNSTHSAYVNSIVINQWNYISITYDKNNIVIYINGISKNSIPSQSNLSVFNDLFLGQNGMNSGFYSGLLDEIRIYNRALSQKEIQALMKIGID